MAIGAVILSILASILCASTMCIATGVSLGMTVAIYAMVGSSMLMSYTLINGFRLSDFR